MDRNLIIDWRITSKCNCSCEYCYASNNISEMSLEDADKIIKKIIESKCGTVCISGGEPLLNSNCIRIIKKLYSYGISVFLSTNGTLFMEHRNEIEKYISKLSLPLDGYDVKSNGVNGRICSDKNSFNSVIEILEYYKNHSHNFSIKIGTVLTNKNADVDHFSKMYNIISKYPVDVWKIYEVVPEEKGQLNYDQLKLSKEEFKYFKYEWAEFIEENKPKIECSIVEKRIRNNAYFIIQPNGKVFLPIEDQVNSEVNELIVGDLLNESFNTVYDEWCSSVSQDNYIKNKEKRFIKEYHFPSLVDDVDKKILFELDKKLLVGNDSISKALNIPQNEVEKRIDRLYNVRAIKHIMPVIDISKFGLNVYLLNIEFKKDETLNSSRIADILCHNESIAWVAECENLEGNNNHIFFRVAIFAKENNEVDHILETIGEILGSVIVKHDLDLVPDKHIYNNRYLLKNDKEQNILDDSHIILNSERTSLSKRELSILLSMKYGKRINMNEISKTTTYKKKTINKTIEKMMSKTIINKFQVVFDTALLGYKCYIFFLKFERMNDRADFVNYVKDIPNVTHINSLNSGKWDMDIEIQVDSPQKFREIYTKVLDYDDIKDSKIMLIKKEHKFRFLIDKTTKALETSASRNNWRN